MLSVALCFCFAVVVAFPLNSRIFAIYPPQLLLLFSLVKQNCLVIIPPPSAQGKSQAQDLMNFI